MDHIANAVFRRPNPKVIFVLGMHRSGTSLLAHTINLMGAFVGEESELVKPHPSINPAGYWERVDIVTEQDRFLQRNGFAWANVANYEIGQIVESQRRDLATRLRGIVENMAHVGSPIVIKDPRLCLVLPIWHEFVAEPVHVVAVRDPRKVAASLMAAFPNSFTTDFLLALWQKYLLSVLTFLIGKRALFVSYERLLEKPGMEYSRLWRGLGELGAKELDAFDETRLNAILDGRLDRSEPSPHARLSEGQLCLFDWLMRRCESEGPIKVVDIPSIPTPTSILRELESVRQSCMRYGWSIGVNSDKNAPCPPLARMA